MSPTPQFLEKLLLAPEIYAAYAAPQIEKVLLEKDDF